MQLKLGATFGDTTVVGEIKVSNPPAFPEHVILYINGAGVVYKPVGSAETTAPARVDSDALAWAGGPSTQGYASTQPPPPRRPDAPFPMLAVPDLTAGCRKACRHGKQAGSAFVCSNPAVTGGGDRLTNCEVARSSGGACGPEAHHMDFKG